MVLVAGGAFGVAGWQARRDYGDPERVMTSVLLRRMQSTNVKERRDAIRMLGEPIECATAFRPKTSPERMDPAGREVERFSTVDGLHSRGSSSN